MFTIPLRALALSGLVAFAPAAALASSPNPLFAVPAETPRARVPAAPLLVAPSWENSNATALAPFLNGQTPLERSGATGGNGQGS